MNNSEQSHQSLSHREAEHMLTDFVFGRLPADHVARMEVALDEFPDLRREADEIRAAFAGFDRQDYLERRKMAARNVSVHVQESLTTSQRARQRNRRFLLRIAPLAAACIIAVLVFPPFEDPNVLPPTVNESAFNEGGVPDLDGLDEFLLAADQENLAELIGEYPANLLSEPDLSVSEFDAADAEILLETSWHVNAGMPVLDFLPEIVYEDELQSLFDGVEHVASL